MNMPTSDVNDLMKQAADEAGIDLVLPDAAVGEATAGTETVAATADAQLEQRLAKLRT